MNVSELFDLAHWVTDEIMNAKIPAKYEALHVILQQHAQPNQPKQPFENQKNDLIATLRKVPLLQLSKDQFQFLNKLGIANAVGEEGIKRIEDILYKNVIDVATSAQKLKEIQKEINKGIQKSDQIKFGLEGCVIEEEYEAQNEILMRVSFTGDASMTNVSDFKKWGIAWYEIGRGIAMVHNATPEDVRVIGATKGSIIIELAVIAGIAATISAIILAALKVADKVLDLRMKAEEIRNLKLKNKRIADEMEKEAENEKALGIDEITSQVAKTLKLKRDGQGDTINALDKAVKNIVNFVESGGEVDFIIPEKDAEGEENESSRPNYDNLKVAFTEIRQLEAKIRLLESISH